MSKNFELNLPGLNELMKSEEMQAILQSACSQVQNRAGNGFGSRVGMGSFTAIGNVFVESDEAMEKVLKENSLLKALDSASV